MPKYWQTVEGEDCFELRDALNSLEERLGRCCCTGDWPFPMVKTELGGLWEVVVNTNLGAAEEQTKILKNQR